MSDPSDDFIDAMYAEWLMTQPEALISNGDSLVKRIEEQWRFDQFIEQLPDQLAKDLLP